MQRKFKQKLTSKIWPHVSHSNACCCEIQHITNLTIYDHYMNMYILQIRDMWKFKWGRFYKHLQCNIQILLVMSMTQYEECKQLVMGVCQDRDTRYDMLQNHYISVDWHLPVNLRLERNLSTESNITYERLVLMERLYKNQTPWKHFHLYANNRCRTFLQQFLILARFKLSMTKFLVY